MASNDAIDRWIVELGDDDVALRQKAEDQLVDCAIHQVQAADKIHKAVNSEDPERAARAAAILKRIRWEDSTDPEPVRSLTVGVACKSIADRCEAIDHLAALKDNAALRALFRIVRRDASPSVQWFVVDCLRQGPPPDAPAMAELESEETSPAALALAAWAWEGRDYRRAGQLFQRALDASPAPARPSNERLRNIDAPIPVPDFVFDSLIRYQNWAGQYPQAARTLRRRLDEAAIVSGRLRTDSLDELIALHGAHGELPGLGWDLVRAAGCLDRPQVLYALNKLFLKKGWRVPAELARRYAFIESGNNEWSRHAVGLYLFVHQWDDLAEVELRQVLALCDNVGNTNAADAHLYLGTMAMRHGDHITACRELEAGLDRARTLDVSGIFNGRTLNNEQSRRYYSILMEGQGLLAAQAAGDEPGQLQRSTGLAQLITATKESDAARAVDFGDLYNFTIAAVPVLKSAGNKEAADGLFTRVYGFAADNLLQDPGSAYWMNYVACICVCCGEHLEEARSLATKAVAAEPHNGYYLDTLADCVFQFGDIDEALRLEKLAAASPSPPPEVQKHLARYGASDHAATRPTTNMGS